MPYEWSPEAPPEKLSLWPYRSLPKKGFVTFIGCTLALVSLPLLAMLGTPVLWGLLPFLAIAVGGVWFALQRSYHDGELVEELTLHHDMISLVRHNPRGRKQEWQANTHWVSLTLHADSGPVENYLTLKGAGREVELGAFLSPDERSALHEELQSKLVQARSYV